MCSKGTTRSASSIASFTRYGFRRNSSPDMPLLMAKMNLVFSVNVTAPLTVTALPSLSYSSAHPKMSVASCPAGSGL